MLMLVEEGHASFSQKKIADRAGISLGNLTYHFPTKSCLLTAAIEGWLSEWQRDFELSFKVVLEDQVSVDRFLDWVMDGAMSHTNTRLFRELWAMSNNDKGLDAALHRLYSEAVDFTLEKFSIPEHGQTNASLRNLMYLVACVSEGASAVFINSPNSEAQPEIIKYYVRKILGPEVHAALKQASART